MKLLFFTFLFWCVATLLDAVSLDTVTTKELQEVIKKNDFVLSVNHIKPKRRIVQTPDVLFEVDFPGSRQKFSLKLERQTKRVVVETYEDGRHRNQYFNVDTLQEDSIIRSLILAVNQSQPGAHATLYLDCISYGKVATPKSLRDMYNSMDIPKLEVSREKKYPLVIDGQKDLRLVLSKNDCPLQPEDDYDDSFNILQDDPFIGGRKDHRADIPILDAIDTNRLFDAINLLIKAVNRLDKEVGQHSVVLDHLRQLIEECELCKQRPVPTLPTCATHNPCAPGVQCQDTNTGPRCGHCPPGYTGTGFECRPAGRTCRDNPCFQGVQCYDTVEGFRCASCPPGYEGNGEVCRRKNPCEFTPCAPGCVPIWDTIQPVRSSPSVTSSYGRRPYY